MFHVIRKIGGMFSGRVIYHALAKEGRLGSLLIIYIITSLWDITRESHTRSIRHRKTEQYQAQKPAWIKRYRTI